MCSLCTPKREDVVNNLQSGGVTLVLRSLMKGCIVFTDSHPHYFKPFKKTKTIILLFETILCIQIKVHFSFFVCQSTLDKNMETDFLTDEQMEQTQQR